MDSSQGNPAYTATTLSKEEIIDTSQSGLLLNFLSKMRNVIFPHCIVFQN